MVRDTKREQSLHYQNRFVGMTGPACWLYWDKDTGRLNEVDRPTGDETDEDKF